MRMLDLFCGRWGWSKAFAARGWKCIGVDLIKPAEIPDGCSFFMGDVLQFLPHWFKPSSGSGWRDFDFICASSPCEQFSTMRNFRPPIPYPELGIKLFNHTREICEASGVPYVMENVAGAQRYVGKADAHCGSYFLWGNGIPPLLHQGLRKGMTELAMGLREHKVKPGWDVRHGVKGKTQTALVATIPPELSSAVADYAEWLVRERKREREIEYVEVAGRQIAALLVVCPVCKTLDLGTEFRPDENLNGLIAMCPNKHEWPITREQIEGA